MDFALVGRHGGEANTAPVHDGLNPVQICGTTSVLRRLAKTLTSVAPYRLTQSLSSNWSGQRLQRGVFRSLVDLQAAIDCYLGEHNHKPKPFVCISDPDGITKGSIAGYQVLASDHSFPVAGKRICGSVASAYLGLSWAGQETRPVKRRLIIL